METPRCGHHCHHHPSEWVRPGLSALGHRPLPLSQALHGQGLPATWLSLAGTRGCWVCPESAGACPRVPVQDVPEAGPAGRRARRSERRRSSRHPQSSWAGGGQACTSALAPHGLLSPDPRNSVLPWPQLYPPTCPPPNSEPSGGGPAGFLGLGGLQGAPMSWPEVRPGSWGGGGGAGWCAQAPAAPHRPQKVYGQVRAPPAQAQSCPAMSWAPREWTPHP